jgi:hypothetical protein
VKEYEQNPLGMQTRVLHPVGNIIFKEGASSLDMKIFKNFNES